MATVAELIVKVGADISDFAKGMEESQKRLQQTASALSSTGRTLTAAVSLPLAAIGVAATKMAMEAVESENLFTVSMGKMGDAARAWSQDLSKSLGLNEYELRKNVGMLYTMTQSMGLSEKTAYDMSTGITKLAYDMASFFNLPVEQAFQKLRSGLVGETEPLRQLGILVDENTIKTWAYANGLAAQGTELTQQQKVMARFGVIMQQTTTAQGDLARTIDSPTNQLRIMREQVTQLGIQFGMSLLPVVQQLIVAAKPLVEGLSEAVKRFDSLSPAVKNTIIGIAALALALGPVMWGLGGMIGGFGKIIPLIVGFAKVTKLAVAAQWLLNVAMNMNPIGLIISAISVLIAAVVLMWNKWDWFHDAIINIWGNIKKKALDMVSGVLGYLSDLVSFIPGLSASIDAFKQRIDAMRVAEENLQRQRAWSVSAMGDFRKAEQEVGKQTKGATQATEDWHKALQENANGLSSVGQQIDGVAAKQAALKDQLDATTKSLKDQVTWSVEAGKVMRTTTFGGVTAKEPWPDYQAQARAAIGERDWDAAVRAVAEASHLDMSDAAHVVTTNWLEKQGAIPGLASGGIVRRPTLAMIGEAGPEAVVPLDRMGQSVVINATINVSGARSPGDTAQAVATELRRLRLAHS